MSGGAAAAAEADIAGTMTRGDRCRRMLQEGSSIDIAAVISGHIAAAPNVSSRRGRAFPRAAASSADYRGKRRLLQYLVLKLRALARGDCVATSGAGDDKTKLEKGSVESTHKVPTSHYRTKHCHAAVAQLGGLTHR